MIDKLKRKAENVARFFWNVLAVGGIVAIYFFVSWKNDGMVIYFEKEGEMKMASTSSKK